MVHHTDTNIDVTSGLRHHPGETVFRIFGTYSCIENMSQLTYGIDTHMTPEENSSIGNLLAIPFQKYHMSIDYSDKNDE